MFNFLKKKNSESSEGVTAPAENKRAKNPHKSPRFAERNFFDSDVESLMPSWATQATPTDYELSQQKEKMRARSRELAMQNPYGKKFLSLMRSNIVGPKGVICEPQVMRGASQNSQPDEIANAALSRAWEEFTHTECDYSGIHSLIDLSNMAVSSLPTDGEFIFREYKGRDAGKFGYQLKFIDPALLDISRNQREANGNITRMGIEYDQRGRRVRYYFKDLDATGNYQQTKIIIEDAANIIHGFLPEYSAQSQGVPWMATGIARMKMLEGYDMAALTAARAGASKMGFFSGESEDAYEGEELESQSDPDGPTITNFKPGTFEDIGNRKFETFDPSYPNSEYAPFSKQMLHAISSGWGVSYASLSNSLEGVNYSSIRAGVMEDREFYKGLQEWFIRVLISRVYKSWLESAYLNGAIIARKRPLTRNLEDYYPVKFQPKRWAWVDPLKDMQASVLAIQNNLTSEIDVIREQGKDPEKVLSDRKKFQETAKQMGLTVTPQTPEKSKVKNDEPGSEDESGANDDETE
jgi:lambda family phage portal protein